VCAVGPNYKEPQVQVPEQYGQSATTQPATQPAVAQTPAAWWTTFNDETLNRLIVEARQSNLDLRTAEARVREARAARGIASADYWPDIDACRQLLALAPEQDHREPRQLRRRRAGFVAGGI
jgi:outer membrane protein TolC